MNGRDRESAASQFTPEFAHVRIDGASEDMHISTPDLLDQVLASIGLAVVLDEEVKELELNRRQVELDLPLVDTDRDLLTPEMNDQPALANDLGRLLPGSSSLEPCFHASSELKRVERLDYIVIRSDPETHQTILELRFCGQKDHWDFASGFAHADGIAKLKSIPIRQCDVEENQVKTVHLKCLPRISEVRAYDDFGGAVKDSSHHSLELRSVFYEKNLGHTASFNSVSAVSLTI